jgi:hypothetical protein
MKFSTGLATSTLLFAAVIVDATLHDTVAHKRHATHVNTRDVARRAGKRCKSGPPGNSSSIQPNNLTLTHPASYATPNVPTKSPASKFSSQNPPVRMVAHKASGVINVNPGKCNPIGASSMWREAFVGRRVDLTAVIIRKCHKAKRPQRQH